MKMLRDMINTIKSQRTKYPTIDTLYSSFKPENQMFTTPPQEMTGFKKGGKVQVKEEMPKAKPN